MRIQKLDVKSERKNKNARKSGIFLLNNSSAHKKNPPNLEDNFFLQNYFSVKFL